MPAASERPLPLRWSTIAPKICPPRVAESAAAQLDRIRAKFGASGGLVRLAGFSHVVGDAAVVARCVPLAACAAPCDDLRAFRCVHAES